MEGSSGSAMLLPFLSSPSGRAEEWCSLMSHLPLGLRVYVKLKRAYTSARAKGSAVAGYVNL